MTKSQMTIINRWQQNLAAMLKDKSISFQTMRLIDGWRAVMKSAIKRGNLPWTLKAMKAINAIAAAE